VLKGDHNDAQTISGGGHRVRSSTSRLPKHRVVPADVCDAQYPVLRPSYGPDIDVTVAVSPPRASRLSRRSLWSNGRSSLEVVHRVRSSTSRLPKHHVVPADVCDAQYPVAKAAIRPRYRCNGRRQRLRGSGSSRCFGATPTVDPHWRFVDQPAA
jgi:hypothetical protein